MKTIAISPRQPARPRAWLPAWWLAAGATGAFAMYFLDPDSGRRRRNVTRDRLAGAVRRGWRAFGRTGRRLTAETYGLAQQAQHVQPEHWSVPNDATLVQRVESELFRDPDVPKGRININAEAGMIALRGVLDRPEQIRAVENAVSRMPGVRGVQNLLHLPGTPVPNLGSVLPAS